MKKILYIIGAFVALSLASCVKDVDVEVGADLQSGAVQFSAGAVSSMTKVTGTTWDKGDAIGVCSFLSANGFDMNTALRYNVEYNTMGGSPALFTVADADQAIYYREDCAPLDFWAYYPYQSSWTPSSMTFDITAQNNGSLSDADLMFSDLLANQTDGEQSFSFTHSLSKVVITLKHYDVDPELISEPMTLVEASLDGVNTMFNVLSEETSVPASIVMDVDIAEDGHSATLSAILLPGQTDATLTVCTSEMKYDIKLSDSLAACKQYNYQLVICEPEVEPEIVSMGISEWVDGGSLTTTTSIECVNGVYQIYTAKGMKIFADLVNSGDTTINAKLMNNINLEGSADNQWRSIGTLEIMYQGTFDGNGFEISGLYQSGLSENGFICSANNATIRDLTVSGEITASSFAAGIAVYARNSTIISCHNKVAVTSDGFWVGGIVANALGGSIINCVNSAAIIGSSSYTGGIVGFMDSMDSDGSLVNCCNVGQVTGSGSSCGAIAGTLMISGDVTNSYYISGSCAVGAGGTYFDQYMISMSPEEVQSNICVAYLNNGAYTYNATSPTIEACAWKAADGGYPVLDLGNYDLTYTQIDIIYDTVSETYLIYTDTGLTKFAAMVNEGNYTINGKLMANIELNGAWTPMIVDGYNGYGYEGTFNGNGYSITGLSVSGSESGQGLFGTCYKATIQNLKVGGEVSSSASHAGIIIGKAWYSTIENCETLEGSVVTGTSGDSYAGIIAYAYNCTLSSCVNRATIDGNQLVAGIVGYANDNNYYTSIDSCANYGTIIGTKFSGGIIGSTNSGAVVKINNCYNEGSVTATTSEFAGGITGKIYGSSSGISTITNCANVGIVSGVRYVGGLAGANQGGYIYNSYNLAEVKCSSSEVGGLVGIHEVNSSTYYAHMENCYTSAVVSGVSNVGLVVGKCDGATITSCYYDDSQSGAAIGLNNDSQTATAYTSLSALLTSLNSGTSEITNAATWVAGSKDYPTFSFLINN